MRIFVSVCATVPPSTCLRIQNVYFDKSTCELISIAKVVPFKEEKNFCSKLVGFFNCRKPTACAVEDQVVLDLKVKVKSLRIITVADEIQLERNQNNFRDMQSLFEDSEHVGHFSRGPWNSESGDIDTHVPISIRPVLRATAAYEHDSVMTDEQIKLANREWQFQNYLAQTDKTNSVPSLTRASA